MPNWVYNKVEFGTDKVLKECISTYKDGVGTYFDFDKLIPMPKELNEYNAPNYDEAKAKELTKKYGAPDWYKWRVKNWGTKWEPSETYVFDDNTVEFQTAWDTPFPIFQKVSKKYHTTVYVEYADEDLGSNCGRLKFINGECVMDESAEDDFDFACRVWGFDPEEERKYRGIGEEE